SAVGLMTRWNGHTDTPIKGWQPKAGWIPLGTIGWWQNDSLILHRYGGEVGAAAARELQLHVVYMWRLRTEAVSDGQVRYSLRVWQEGTPEPSTWDLRLVEPSLAPRGGSPAFITYRADATFGNVQVLPLPGGSGMQSDDFNAPALNANLWAFTNPLGDAALAVEGAYTGDAHAVISVPEGSAHDVWTAGNQAPRIMQKCNDTDFEIEARFDSPLTRQYQIEGIIVEQDAGNYIRFDFHTDGAGTRVFAAKFIGGRPTAVLNRAIGSIGIAPLFMRVRRAGNAWTQSYSIDGAAWTAGASLTHVLAVSSAGVFAGNAGSAPPAFTARVDYFFLTSAPIVPEDGYQPQPLTISSAWVAPGKTAAVVTWTTNSPASSSVRWGATPACDAGTATEPGLVIHHSVALQNLAPATIYYCEISSRDAEGVTAAESLQFQTHPNTASGIVSDDFNSPYLNSVVWTLINPRNDATLMMEGADTGDARVAISVSEGSAHDVWIAGNQAPRIMQKCNDTDFEIEVKFDSPLTRRYQIQGIVIDQDAGNYIRFDFHSDGSSTRIFASTCVSGKPAAVLNRQIAANGIAPLYMRVRRAGNAWTQSYSADGATWTVGASFTHTLAVASAGAFAGNAGAVPPAFTSRIDYFFLTSAPIVPEDGRPPLTISSAAASPAKTSATVTWTTSSPAAGSARWGLTPAYEAGTATDATPAVSHSVSLQNLIPGSLYYCEITSQDIYGTSASAMLQFTTLPGDPPGIVSDNFDAPALDSGVWTFVNPLNDGYVIIQSTALQEACAAIAVPAGTPHDIWTAGNQAPRIMQPAANADFEIEVRFCSPVLRQYQIQGIIVEQDAGNFIRFDFHSNGSTTNTFVATFAASVPKMVLNRSIGANGAAPLYMCVKRTGNQWTQTYSFDGVTWQAGAAFSHSLNVTTVGICAGNAGTAAPEFTALADYFLETSTPPAP
ncbi:MAG TPA: hypothetical protein VM223_13940, partial [Planctomycetota bacterium]|nr:hypothetical protein [Planctomycetota bacterium]